MSHPPADLGIRGIEDAVEVGRGGFAVVYRARQPELNRTIAIKMLSARLDEAGAQRFALEGWAMGTLSGHPNIVTVIETGVSASGRPYIAMPYLGEGSLADRIRRDGPLRWPEAVRIGIRLAGALESAHQAGTLHRDVKPENVLISDYGEPQLTDFGIARVEGRYETGTGHVVLSAAHASPEVLDGQAATVASDVYSLGSTLYAVLAGNAAFRRQADEPLMAMYLRVARDPVPDLRARGVPDDVCKVIERAMAKEPADRQASAAEVGRQLQDVQERAGQPVAEMALAQSERGTGDGLPPRPTADISEDETGAAEIERAESGRGSRRVRAAGMAAAVAALVVLVAAVLIAGGGEDEVASGGLPGVTTTAVVAGPNLPGVPVGEEPTSAATNPRNNRLYVANSGSVSVSVVDGTTKAPIATIPMPTRPQVVAVNQRSERVYVTTAEASVVVIDGGTHQIVGTVPLRSRPVGMAIDHRTDRIFVALSEPSLAVIDGPSGRVAATIALPARPGSVAVIPEINRVYVTGQDGTLSVVDGATSSVVATVPVGPRPCGVAANPRNRRVYVTSQDAGTMTVLDGEANTVITTVPVASRPCGVAVNPQTSRVYVLDQETGRAVLLDGGTNVILKAIDVSAPSRAAELLPYAVEVNPQNDGIYFVDRAANRVTTLSADLL